MNVEVEVQKLIKLSAEATTDSSAALRFSQAALNIAHTAHVLRNTKDKDEERNTGV